MGGKNNTTKQTSNQTQATNLNTNQTQNLTSQTGPTAQVLAYNTGLLNQIQGASATPYVPYTGELTAGINPYQSQTFNNIANLDQNISPYAAAAAAPVTPIQYTPGELNTYMNPYIGDVANTSLAAFENINQQQQAQMMGNAATTGLGGDRSGVNLANLATQQALTENPQMANIYAQGFSGAQTEFNTQQQAALQAGIANQQAALGAGNLVQNAQATNAGLGLQAGSTIQQTQQAADTAALQQYYYGLQYPFLAAQFAAQTSTPVTAQMGTVTNATQNTTGQTTGTGTSTGTGTTTTPGPSLLSEVAGLGLAGAAAYGLAARGGRIKGYQDGGVTDPSNPRQAILKSLVGTGTFGGTPGMGATPTMPGTTIPITAADQSWRFGNGIVPPTPGATPTMADGGVSDQAEIFQRHGSHNIEDKTGQSFNPITSTIADIATSPYRAWGPSPMPVPPQNNQLSQSAAKYIAAQNPQWWRPIASMAGISGPSEVPPSGMARGGGIQHLQTGGVGGVVDEATGAPLTGWDATVTPASNTSALNNAYMGLGKEGLAMLNPPATPPPIQFQPIQMPQAPTIPSLPMTSPQPQQGGGGQSAPLPYTSPSQVQGLAMGGVPMGGIGAPIGAMRPPIPNPGMRPPMGGMLPPRPPIGAPAMPMGPQMPPQGFMPQAGMLGARPPMARGGGIRGYDDGGDVTDIAETAPTTGWDATVTPASNGIVPGAGYPGDVWTGPTAADYGMTMDPAPPPIFNSDGQPKTAAQPTAAMAQNSPIVPRGASNAGVAPPAAANAAAPAIPGPNLGPIDYAGMYKQLYGNQATQNPGGISDARMAMIMAGLGIAAGGSHWPLQNIGAGGMQGMQYFAQQRNLQADREAKAFQLALAQRQSDLEAQRLTQEAAFQSQTINKTGFNPLTGQLYYTEGPMAGTPVGGGAPGNNPDASNKLTTQQAKGAGFSRDAIKADEIITKNQNINFTEPTLQSAATAQASSVPFGLGSGAANYVASDNRQQLNTAQTQFLSAINKGVTPSQADIDAAYQQYFPRWSDGAAELEAKRANRASAIHTLNAEGGMNYTPPPIFGEGIKNIPTDAQPLPANKADLVDKQKYITAKGIYAWNKTTNQLEAVQ